MPMKRSGFKKPSLEEIRAKNAELPQKPRSTLKRTATGIFRAGSLSAKGRLKAGTAGKGKKKKKVPSTKGVQSKFNLIVRERANWICVKCGRDCSERRGLLHASHFWAVGFTATRFDFDNVDALCYPCHYGQMRTGWEYNKHGDYRTFMINKLGQDGYDALEQKARSGMKLLDAKELFLSSLKSAV